MILCFHCRRPIYGRVDSHQAACPAISPDVLDLINGAHKEGP